MDRLPKKLTRVMEHVFRGAALVLQPPDSDRKLSGFLVWSGFARHDQLARQDRIVNVLKKSFSRSEQSRISHLFAFTPREWKSYEQDRIDEEQAILQTAANIRRERARRKRFLAGLKHAV